MIIADYVEEHAQELGVWMEQLAQGMHRFPLRFLLIGRKTGDVSAGFDWNNQQLNIFLSIKNKNRTIQGTELSLAPEKLQDDVKASPSSLLLARKTDEGFSWERQFYNGIYDRQLIRKACFRPDYLELKSLSDKALRSIIRDYAVAIRKDNKTSRAILDRRIEEKLLDKLKAIDPVLCRPLYAMFLTSAYMNGNEPERWGREDVLDYMIERELSRLEFGVRDVMGLKSTDRKLFAACQYLQCISTTLQGVSVGKVQEICPDIWEVIEKKSEYFESSIDLLYQLGLIDRDRMPALRPDLIGEYFVFTWLGKQREETINRFLTAVWKIPCPTVVFFSRIFNDYGFLLDESAEKWEMLLLKNLPQSVDSAILYSMFLMNITGNCNIQRPCEKCVQQLKALNNLYSDVPEIMIVYANSMANLIIRQETANAKGTAKVLEEFASSHSDIPELTIALARGLINLGEKKDSSIIPRIANRLERLVEEYPNMPEVANCFAESLIQLGNTMTGQEALNNIQKLESLAKKYPESSEIIIKFSEGVYNLTVDQDRCFIELQVKRLEELVVAHPDIPSIVIMLSKGLFNLSVKLEGEEERTVIKRLETLAASYSCVPEVAIEFAKSLVNLSSQQTLHEKRNTLKQLDRLASILQKN